MFGIVMVVFTLMVRFAGWVVKWILTGVFWLFVGLFKFIKWVVKKVFAAIRDRRGRNEAEIAASLDMA